MALHLPNDIELFQSDWTENVKNLFNGIESAIPTRLNRLTSGGHFVSARFVILDQIDPEIYFPVIKLKNDLTGSIKEKVAAFRESVDIPDGFCAIEETDFGLAKDRNCYLASFPKNTTEWAKATWDAELATEPNPHNDDKNDFSTDAKVMLKFYTKAALKVLHEYKVRGIYYPNAENTEEDGRVGMIHVIDCEDAAVPTNQDSDPVDFGLYEDIVALFEQLLLGDTLAAKFMVSALISKVYLRREDLILGGFALNLNLKSVEFEMAEYIRELLALVVPTLKCLPLSIKNLNAKPFIPVKDYDREELIHSELSVSPNTLLLLDETKVSSGNVTQVGMLNISVIGDIIERQSIKFDYQFYQKDFETNITTIILTHGKSLLPSDYSLKLHSKMEISDNSEYFKSLIATVKASGILPKMRRFLGHCKTIEYSVNNEEMVQNFIVETRKADEKIGIPQLHQILVLARSLAIARGEKEAKEHFLEEARDMIKKLNDRM